MNLHQITKGFAVYRAARDDADAPPEVRDLVSKFDSIIGQISSVTGLPVPKVTEVVDEVLAVASFAPSLASESSAEFRLHKQADWFKTEPQSFMLSLIPDEITGGASMSRRLLELNQAFKNTDGDISNKDAKWLKGLVESISDVAATRHGVDPFDNYDYLRRAVGEQNASVIKHIYTKVPQNINRGVGTSSLKVSALRALSNMLGAPEVSKGYSVLPLGKRIGIIFSILRAGFPVLLGLAKLATVVGAGYVLYRGYGKLKDILTGPEGGTTEDSVPAEKPETPANIDAEVSAPDTQTTSRPTPADKPERDPAKLVLDTLLKRKKSQVGLR